MKALPFGPLRILVFGSGSAAFLGAVRSLGRRGHAVWGAWGDTSDEDFPASVEARSRYLRGRLAIPPSWQPGWLDALLERVHQDRIDLLIPGDDASLLALDPHRATIEEHVALAMPPSHALHTLSSKVEATALARSLGVAVAEGWTVTAGAFDVAEFADAPFPLVVKPQASRLASAPQFRQTVRRVDNIAELREAVTELMKNSTQVEIQRFFRGRGVGVAILLCGGEERLAFQHLRLHEPMAGGGSSYRAQMMLDDRMHAGALSLLQAAAFEGVAMVEFKWNPTTNEHVFIEVNPRFWGAMPLAIASGFDFPAVWVDSLQGLPSPAIRARYGLHSRRVEEDLRWMSSNLQAQRDDPYLNRVPLTTVVAETIGSVLGGKERLDTFTTDDRAPGWHELALVGRWFASAIARRAIRLRDRIPPWRWVRARDLRHRYRRATSVLVVCKGNICRSPYLAMLLARDVEIRQGGFLQRPGRSSPDDAIGAAARLGMDLTPHRSAGLTAADIEWADLVLVFDDEGVEAVLHLAPTSRAKVAKVGYLVAQRSSDIPDPYGEGPAAFDHCYANLDIVATALKAARHP